MIRILIATALWLGTSLPLQAQAPSPAGQPAPHAQAIVKLSAQQIDAGKFAVEAVAAGALERRLTVPGSIVPSGDHIARIAVRLLGTVAELRKRLGDAVTVGEVVAIIESREVADAKGDYLAARLVIDLQQTLFNRAKTLWDGKVMSENDFLRARTTFEDARVKLELSRQKLFALSLNAEQIEALPQQPVETLRRQELRAPISGRIAERRVELGSLVGREGQESELFTIVDLGVVWAELAVSPADLRDIREGQTIRIADGDVSSPATILFISPLLDKETRTARVVASVDNTARRWRPGAFVTAEIAPDPASTSIVVPMAALQTLERKPVVFVRTTDGFEARPVTLGRQNNRMAEVTSGLKPGERIATANSFILKADLGKAAAEHQH
ncbi:efflux RND transporter periplasmic adaptor subunit [Tardiphaga sp.]|uniref:efflux RND transporter periplasmic adaptor subunit n=1 Tax=Tardiphaga sp. TaxID=1926292 RepID=UPI0025D68AAF|nr:efflux RND transporter periplasmic adaptor subunit [Tardiphaga sp.]